MRAVQLWMTRAVILDVGVAGLRILVLGCPALRITERHQVKSREGSTVRSGNRRLLENLLRPAWSRLRGEENSRTLAHHLCVGQRQWKILLLDVVQWPRVVSVNVAVSAVAPRQTLVPLRELALASSFAFVS